MLPFTIDREEKAMLLEENQGLLHSCFKESRYSLITPRNKTDAVNKSSEEPPDLIMGNLDCKKMDVFTVCVNLRSDFQLKHVPIIVTGGEKTMQALKTAFPGVVDDYLEAPFDQEELLLRVERVMARTRSYLEANPLTRLPGNEAIRRQIVNKMLHGKSFSLSWLDLDHFKAFNDKYGWERGDQMLSMLASTVRESIKSVSENQHAFAGHVGGDDFVLISDSEINSMLCERIIDCFDKRAPDYYDAIDSERGFIQVKDRDGIVKRFPLMKLSIGVVEVRPGKDCDIGKIFDLAVMMKKKAKAVRGSCIEIGRFV